MTAYGVLAIKREKCAQDALRTHVTMIGTGRKGIYDRTWSVADVQNAIRAGDLFYIDLPSDRIAHIECSYCPWCGAPTVQTDSILPDGIDAAMSLPNLL
jgi:hypothetical protein